MAAAVRASEGVAVCNIPGQSMHMSEVIAAIEAAVPEAWIDYEDIALPFPEQLAIGELAARSRRSRRACARRSSCSAPAHSDTLGR
jgi:hypothetical protein